MGNSDELGCGNPFLSGNNDDNLSLETELNGYRKPT